MSSTPDSPSDRRGLSGALAAFRQWLAVQPRWRQALVGLGGVLAGVFLLMGVAVAALLPQLPDLDRVTDYQPRQPLQVFTRDGVEIAQFGSERRVYLPLAQIPRRMQDAVVAVEDARFREHSGIDPIGIARAAWSMLTGGSRQGASTITQQVARTFFLSSRRTLERKLKEVLLALKIEQKLSKDEILELYLNQIYLGHRAYGFGAAAQVYFGKTLDQLGTAEVAMLAGLPQNPAYANPISNLERATTRQRVVLQRMLVTGVINQAEHDAARAQKLVIRSRLYAAVHAEHVAEMARKVVYEKYGERAYTEGFKVTTSLVAVEQQAAWTALRRGLMDHERRQPWRGPEDQEELPADAEPGSAAVAQALKEHRDDEDLRVAIVLQASPKEIRAQLASGEVVSITGEGLRWAQSGLGPKATKPLLISRGSILRLVAQSARPARGATTEPGALSWSVVQWPQVQGALVSMEPTTGRVRALVGGFDFTRQPFNHVTQAWRQPGSSFKPFLYSAALEHGIMPETLVNDAPLHLPDSEAVANGAWNPQNSDGEFAGPITLRQALAKSKNLVSVRVLRHLGTTQALDWVQKFGFDRERHPDNLTLALGAGSTTPMQMAAAYSVFANGGYRVATTVIERVTDAAGKVVFEAPAAAPLVEENRVLPARNVFLTGTLMQEVTRSGTAARAQGALKRSDLYGKTGTTNDAVDAWFAGYQPGVVAVVWIGYDEPRSLGSRETGGGLALPVWIGYMDRALRGVAPVQPPVPDGVVDVGGQWRYGEYAEGGFVPGIGLEDTVMAGDAPVSAASGSLGAAPAASGAAVPQTER
jgi:penicillin-binding protein 1A